VNRTSRLVFGTDTEVMIRGTDGFGVECKF
jgi:hypothetical protein